MANENTDFLRFSAYSIKELITRKLSESSKFTDQIYEGSNLAVLIDIFSHMAQCLLYSLNNAAAESMFSDTQIYENMNRLVKFIGYNPHGIGTSTINLVLDQQPFLSSSEVKEHTIYKYSTIDTGKYDSRGAKIYYSTAENAQTNSNNEFQMLFYNGSWNLYDTVLTSDGTQYQKFVLSLLESDMENSQFVVDGMVHVYVEAPDGSFSQYKAVNEGLFTDNNINNGSYVYTGNDEIVDVRLNENKTYELTFGNGFTGKIPPKDSKIYIMYLKSNGMDAALEPFELTDKTLEHSSSLFGMSTLLYAKMFKNGNLDAANPDTSVVYSSLAKWTNTSSSSFAVPEETVDEIRRYAPSWFKTGNRLVTTSDYEYYVKNRFRGNIVDVKCQNNWQYMSTFYQWLYNLGMNGKRLVLNSRPKLGTYYLNQNSLQRYDLRYADAADGNNVYLWIKMNNDSDVYKQKIDNEILNIKCLTQEAVYLNPLNVYFTFCAADQSDALNYFVQNNGMFDPDNESYLEITLDDNTLYSNNDIALKAADAILDFFNEKNFKLGQTIDYAQLTNILLNITAVTRIRTIYHNNATGNTRIINGISFATWTADLIDPGDDLAVSSTARTLEVFQFPKLYRSADIQSKIKVIRKTISNVNSIQY